MTIRRPTTLPEAVYRSSGGFGLRRPVHHSVRENWPKASAATPFIWETMEIAGKALIGAGFSIDSASRSETDTVIDAISQYARDGNLKTYSRALDGGALRPLAASAWFRDDYREVSRLGGFPSQTAPGCASYLFTDKIISGEDVTPGRPSLAHKVMPEFQRRLKSGEVQLKIGAEARALAAWYAGAFPFAEGHRPLRPKAIEPYIRDQINSLKKTAENVDGNVADN